MPVKTYSNSKVLAQELQSYTMVEAGDFKKKLLSVEDDTLDTLQFALDIGGLIPVIGFAPDLLNGAIFLARGRYAEAGMSFFSAIPGIGLAGSGPKYVAKSTKLLGKSKGLKFKANPQTFKSISRKYHKAQKNILGKADSIKIFPKESLDHWFFQQNGMTAKWVQSRKWVPDTMKDSFTRFTNGGWNLVELPGWNPFHHSLGLNQFMGLAPNWKGRHNRKVRVTARLLRIAVTTSIPISLINGGIKGARIGMYISGKSRNPSPKMIQVE